MRKVKVTKGKVLWTCFVFEGKVEFDEWIVRSIQNRTFKSFKFYKYNYKRKVAYLVKKVKGLTWIKKSKKHFDWGWAPNIPSHCKEHFILDEDNTTCSTLIPFTTRLQAAKSCLQTEKSMLLDSVNDLEEYRREWTTEEIEDQEKWIADYKRGVTAAKRAITREQNKGKKQ